MSVPSLGNWRAVQVLLILLSVTAGCTDIIGFLGLNQLFLAHITGNLAMLAAHIVAGDEIPIAKVLSVPVFATMVSLTVLLAGSLETIGLSSLGPLLLLQLLLLAGFLVICVAAGPHVDPNASIGILAGMLGVSAMAVQNALVQISLKEAPPTGVMTGNVTRFAIDIGKVLFGGHPADVANALDRAVRTLPVIMGFAIGCGLGAVCEAAFDLWSLAVPVGLATLAFVTGFAAEPAGDNGPARGFGQ
jgi:uncharacterized membrane protein YoaK (UPF0700 family)